RWLWQGRHVYLFDGTTVTMPDSPANQEAYPQVYNQQPGVGFPIARVGALISLACGAILNLGVCRYAGKGQGEVSLLRALWDLLRPRDIPVPPSRLNGKAPRDLETMCLKCLRKDPKLRYASAATLGEDLHRF